MNGRVDKILAMILMQTLIVRRSLIFLVEEPFARKLKNISVALTIKDPTHPFALYIDGPSVSQPQNSTVSSRNTVLKVHNEMTSLQRDKTETALDAPGNRIHLLSLNIEKESRFLIVEKAIPNNCITL